jgi:large subunit ribosomal protein L13
LSVLEKVQTESGGQNPLCKLSLVRKQVEIRAQIRKRKAIKMQKSYRAPNPGENRQWFVIDAKDRPLGRLAVVVANKLRAKDLPTFDPSVDAGAFVVVTNAALVKLTGNKESQKEYQRYSGFRGGRKTFTAEVMRASHPDRMIKEAVWGMLPKNNIARKMMTRLKVFVGAEHTHAAQKPVEIKM